MRSPTPTRNGGARERGATSILNYALLLAIVTLVVAGLLSGVGELVEDQQERAVRSQLDTVGNRLAADIETASRVVTESGAEQMRLRTVIPETVGGSYYRVDVSPDGDQEIRLRSSDPEVRTTVEFRSSIPVTGSVSGGQLVIEYDDGDSGELEVRDD